MNFPLYTIYFRELIPTEDVCDGIICGAPAGADRSEAAPIVSDDKDFLLSYADQLDADFPAFIHIVVELVPVTE